MGMGVRFRCGPVCLEDAQDGYEGSLKVGYVMCLLDRPHVVERSAFASSHSHRGFSPVGMILIGKLSHNSRRSRQLVNIRGNMSQQLRS